MPSLSGSYRTKLVSRTKSALYKIGTRKVARTTIVKILNHYKVNQASKNKLISAYNKYLNSLNNINNKKAYNNAEKAAESFIVALIHMYEKSVNSAPTPVSRGLENGTRKTLLWWLPGVIYRGTLKQIAGPKIQRNLN